MAVQTMGVANLQMGVPNVSVYLRIPSIALQIIIKNNKNNYNYF